MREDYLHAENTFYESTAHHVFYLLTAQRLGEDVAKVFAGELLRRTIEPISAWKTLMEELPEQTSPLLSLWGDCHAFYERRDLSVIWDAGIQEARSAVLTHVMNFNEAYPDVNSVPTDKLAWAVRMLELEAAAHAVALEEQS